MLRSLLVVSLCLVVSDLRAQPRESDPDIGTVQVHNETVYYDVEGYTAHTLLAGLTEHGPVVNGKRFFGLTEWEVNAEYRWVEHATRCSIDDLTVRVSVKTHLPQWRAPVEASFDTRAAWTQFVTALDEHEGGHRRLAEEAGEAIRWRLISLHTPTCDRIRGEAQRAVVAVLDEYDAHNRTYDAETGHGRTQDAVWPPAHLIAGVR